MRPRLIASEIRSRLRVRGRLRGRFNEAEANRLGNLCAVTAVAAVPLNCFNEAEANRLGNQMQVPAPPPQMFRFNEAEANRLGNPILSLNRVATRCGFNEAEANRLGNLASGDDGGQVVVGASMRPRLIASEISRITSN